MKTLDEILASIEERVNVWVFEATRYVPPPPDSRELIEQNIPALLRLVKVLRRQRDGWINMTCKTLEYGAWDSDERTEYNDAEAAKAFKGGEK